GCEQRERHRGRGRKRQTRTRVRPGACRGARAQDAVRREQTAEPHRVSGQKRPHAGGADGATPVSGFGGGTGIGGAVYRNVAHVWMDTTIRTAVPDCAKGGTRARSFESS